MLPALARACLLIALCAPAVRAQAPAYARSPADTLRYHETLRGTIDTDPMAGGHAEQTREARLALTFTGGDTARAWYQVLEARTKTGNGHSTLEMPRRGMPGGFTLRIAPSGRVRTLSVPTPPPPLEMEIDSIFGEQFVDFFPVLPDAPLRPGLEWTDSDTANPGRGRFTRTTRSRVVRDTMAGGRGAVIVETQTQLTITRADVVDEELSVRTELEGTEHGRFVFAPDPGLLLRRERTGTLRGTETYLVAGIAPRGYRQTREYTRVIELLDEP